MIIANKLTNVNLKTVCAHNFTLYTSLTDFCMASMELCYDVIKKSITWKVSKGRYYKEWIKRKGLWLCYHRIQKRSTPKD